MGADVNIDIWNGFSKSQLLKLIMQTLRDMGYNKTFNTLQEESSVIYQDEKLNKFENLILNGDIFTAKLLLNEFDLDPEILKACKFLCSNQIFLETLHNSNISESLRILRDVLTPEAFDEESTNRVHQCAALLLCDSSDVIKSELNWVYETSRSELWKTIQFIISPTITLPPNRLLTLLRQACELQELHCQNHCEVEFGMNYAPSLLLDHKCDEWILPSKSLLTLEKHTDEIWDISISPNNKYFATASKDETVILWSAIYPFYLIYQWKVHQNVVSCIAWSYDSELLASCGNDGLIVIWNPNIKDYLVKIEPHTAVATSVSWLPKSWKFITAGMDKQMMLHEVIKQYDDTFKIITIQKWIFDSRIRTISINMNGTLAIFATIDRILRVWDLNLMKEITPIPENASITTVCCSKIYNQILVSVAGQRPVMRLWDIDERRVIQTYRGHREDRYVLRSILGGPNESFVVSGSEDAQIYIWNKIFGSLLAVIPAHSSTVNAVAWSCGPNSNYIFSVSDDQTIAVWEPKVKHYNNKSNNTLDED